MTIAVSRVLLWYPDASMGRKPSKGGSLRREMWVGGGLGELRPEAAAGASWVVE